MQFLNKLVLVSVLALGVAACGGGGSAGPAAGANTLSVAPVISTTTNTATISEVDTTPNVMVAKPTYAAGGEEDSAFDYINKVRIQIGLGPYNQDTKLDASSKGHADWMALNKVYGHFQSAGTMGFTGVNAVDRVSASGYKNKTSDFFRVMETISSPFVGSASLSWLTNLLNAPYHALELISSHRDIGIGIGGYSYQTNSLVGGILGTTTVTQNFQVLNMSTKETQQKQYIGVDQVAIFPCNGVEIVDFTLTGETPNPVPGRNLAVNPLGTSVVVRVREGQVLTLSSATMTKVSDGSTVPMRTPVTQKNDPNVIYLDVSSGFVSADVPMLPLTQYRTVVTGTNDGRGFVKTCDFTTGV